MTKKIQKIINEWILKEEEEEPTDHDVKMAFARRDMEDNVPHREVHRETFEVLEKRLKVIK